MRGQTIFGAPCAWCGSPAEGTVEIAPPVKDAKTGEWKDGVAWPACGAHMRSVEVTAPIGRPLRRRARDVGQLSLTGDGPANAIGGADR